VAKSLVAVRLFSYDSIVIDSAQVDAPYQLTPLLKDTNPQSRVNSFPTTHWTAVNALKRASEETRPILLSEFLDRYTPAFRMHLIYTRGVTHDQDLEDTIQGFITDKFVAKNILTYVEEDGGRLRTYFRRCLDHYVFSQHNTNKAAAWDRRVEWDEYTHGVHAATTDPCPFDIAWARTVMTGAVLRTKDQFFFGKQPHIWDIFDLRHVRPIFTGLPPASVAELAERFELSEKAVHNRRTTAVRAFGKHLNEIVAEYIGDNPEDVEQELAELNRILQDRGLEV
jgi:hypothetical protein